MANIQVGKYLYNTIDLPFTAKVLNILNKRTAGASLVTIADQPEIKADFNGDAGRAQGKVKVALSNLRFRNVIQEVQKDKSVAYFKILNKDEALTLISEAGKIVNKFSQSVAEAASNTEVSAEKSNTKSKKVNTMSTVSKKAPRLFKNPESSKIEPFGAGRPSKLKLAYECNQEGVFLNPAAALAFAQQGGKAEDKMTKAELLDLLRKVRAERDAALAAVEALTATEVSAESEVSDDTEVSADDADVSDDDDDLDLEAEAVDSDEEVEVEASEID